MAGFDVRKTTKILFVTCLAAIFGAITGNCEVIELEFKKVQISGSDNERSLESLVKIQDPGGVHLNGLYLMTHYGDRKEVFLKENKAMMETPLIDRPWRYCSVFSSKNENSVYMGRNWDNENVGSIIVNLYHPPDGYSSISFSRSIDMNFPLNVDLVDFKSAEIGQNLLLAPFYAFDGINERGLAISVAGVKGVSVEAQEHKELVFAPFLVRKVLDHAKNIDEALKLLERYIPFDLNQHSLNTHFFIVDATGRSVILEYFDGEWKRFFQKTSWQVLANKPIHSLSENDLREKSWRYRSMSAALEKDRPEFDWIDSLKILQDVAQKGTSWSVVYSPNEGDVYFSVYQKWDVVYHLKLPQRGSTVSP